MGARYLYMLWPDLQVLYNIHATIGVHIPVPVSVLCKFFMAQRARGAPVSEGHSPSKSSAGHVVPGCGASVVARAAMNAEVLRIPLVAVAGPIGPSLGPAYAASLCFRVYFLFPLFLLHTRQSRFSPYPFSR